MYKKVLLILSVLIIGLLLVSACQPAAEPATAEEAVEEPAAEEVVEEKAPKLGSAEKPVKVLFIPSLEADVIVAGGKLMGHALEEATGLVYEVSVPTSYPAAVEEMCASPDDTMAFISGFAYVIANEKCGVDVSFKAVRYGAFEYWAAFNVLRDSGIETIEDLEGKTWGYGEASSTSGYIFPKVLLNEAGVTTGEEVLTGGHTQSIAAVYNGEVDFVTTYYTPPGRPDGTEWVFGESPDVPDDVLESCAVTADGEDIDCSGYEIRDARPTIRVASPDVVQVIAIPFVSPGIPNDTLSFGPDFPAAEREVIEQGLLDFLETDLWGETIGSKDFYNWTGITVAADADYDIVRAAVDLLGMTLEQLD